MQWRVGEWISLLGETLIEVFTSRIGDSPGLEFLLSHIQCGTYK